MVELSGWIACIINLATCIYFSERQSKLINKLQSQAEHLVTEMKLFYRPWLEKTLAKPSSNQPAFMPHQSSSVPEEDSFAVSSQDELEQVQEMLRMKQKGFVREVINGGESTFIKKEENN